MRNRIPHDAPADTSRYDFFFELSFIYRFYKYPARGAIAVKKRKTPGTLSVVYDYAKNRDARGGRLARLETRLLHVYSYRIIALRNDASAYSFSCVHFNEMKEI